MAKYELTISRMLQSAGASGFVTIHEAGHDEKSAWIRMDFVEGTILGESDPKNTSKPPEPYISQLCTSIRSALKAGVLPWDLNDGNLILNEDGVTLIDFGLYHIFGDEGNVRPGDYYRDYTRTIKKLFLFAHEQNERTPVDLIKDLVAEMEKTQTSLQGMEMDQEGLNALDAGLRRIGNLSTFYSCL